MSYLADNLKVLLWKNKGELSNRSYAEYIDHVAKQCRMDGEHFRAILRGDVQADDLEERKLRLFFEDFGYDLSAIRYMPLFEDLIEKSGDELLDRNLRFLLQSLERGENGEFIQAIGVNPSTVSRWKQGITKPDRESQRRICGFFGYSDERVLRRRFLFLGLEPVSTQQRKRRCQKLMENMDRDEFEKIYPALIKLLN